MQQSLQPTGCSSDNNNSSSSNKSSRKANSKGGEVTPAQLAIKLQPVMIGAG